MKQRIESARWRIQVKKKKKLPERVRKGKKTQKERRGVKGNAQQHEIE